MRRKLHSVRMKEGDSVQRHIREMTEIFNALSAMDTPMSEEDHVICLLSAIKDSFQKLSLIRSKIFENAVSRTHYEIKT